MQKTLIILGIVIILAGVAWPWLKQLPFGNLPGDIVVKRSNFSFYFPITTMVLLSVVISMILWFIKK